MAKEDNLRPGEYQFSREEQSKGGVASGEARRRKRDLRHCLEMLLEKERTTRSGETLSGAEAVCAKLFEQALKGNVKAFETIRSTVGQDPVQKIMVSEVEQSVIDEVEAIVTGKQIYAVTQKPVGEGKIQKLDKETGEVLASYKTATAAAKENGIDPSNLSKALKNGKVVGGFKWRKRE